MVGGSVFDGCMIDPTAPPPPGYKCNCRHWGFLCQGSLVPCRNPEGVGCDGCATKECCSDDGINGDCNGYDNI